MNNQIKKDFTIIPNDLINNAELSRDSRFLFVYLCSKPDNWIFHNKTIERDIDCSKDSRVKYMKELSDAGWVTVKQNISKDGKFGNNEITLNPYPKFSDALPCPKNTVSEKDRVGKNTTLSNTNINNNTDLFSNTENVVFEKLDYKVLDYLNAKRQTGTGFKKTKTNLGFIKSRIKEGYTFEDFQKVIDSRIELWSKNEKMAQYIRPETLFGSKFDSYLVNSENVKKNIGSDNFEFEPIDSVKLKD